jgi:hypothetical protein
MTMIQAVVLMTPPDSSHAHYGSVHRTTSKPLTGSVQMRLTAAIGREGLDAGSRPRRH